MTFPPEPEIPRRARCPLAQITTARELTNSLTARFAVQAPSTLMISRLERRPSNSQ